MIKDILAELSPSQLGAFHHIKDSKHDVVLIQGHPGTGRTTFIVALCRILSELQISWIACVPGNSATDHLATVLEQKCPELGIIRFHSYGNESRAIRRQEADLAQDDEPDNEQEDSDKPKIDVKAQEADSKDIKGKKAEIKKDKTDYEGSPERHVFHSYIAHLEQKDTEWKGKLGQSDFKDMGQGKVTDAICTKTQRCPGCHSLQWGNDPPSGKESWVDPISKMLVTGGLPSQMHQDSETSESSKRHQSHSDLLNLIFT